MRNACLPSEQPWFYVEEFLAASAVRNLLRAMRFAQFAKRAIPAVIFLFAATFLNAAVDMHLASASGKLPLAFEENHGQAPAGVSFQSRTRSGVVWFRPGSVALETTSGHEITMHFAGTTSPSATVGEEKLPGITSYMIGRESDWVRGVPNFARVRYRSVYPGIDAVFHGDENNLEYDFVLTPGADPSQIRLAFDGVERVAIDSQGDLELTTAAGTMKQRKPQISQNGPRGQHAISGRYILSGMKEARFEVDPYDRHETLVIDPVIEYSTYFGSNRDDQAQAVATDATGAIYVAGSTATGGVSWGFVSKLNPAGTAVMYTVYLGNNTCNAAVHGIAVDAGNNAIVTGYYTQQDAAGACTVKQVLGAKINASGSAFVYELAWGGNQDYGNAVAVDAAGNAYFTGSTSGGGFPTTPGVISPAPVGSGDAFITKLTPAGGLVYSTYLGGSAKDEGMAIALDGAGNAYIGGSTSSANFPVTANAVQPTAPNASVTGFVSSINSTATQSRYSTFLGGDSGDTVYGIALDAQAKIHAAGSTSSPNFPTTANAWDRTCGTDDACNPYSDGALHNAEDGFYAKIDPLKAGLAGLLYSTFLGGTNSDFAEAIAVDTSGRAWITGRTNSTADFPKVRATQAASGGDYDGFIAQIDPAQSSAASLMFSSFIGGALYDEATGVKLDTSGHIYVVGFTSSTNFPLANAIQPVSAGGAEGFVVRIAAPALASIAVNPGTLVGGANSTGTVTITAVAPVGGAVITLTSSNTNAATVPASVTVPAGASTATFPITTKPVMAGTVVTITAAYSGVSKAIGLVVNPLLSSITLNPVVLTGGAASTGTVTLFSAAPAGGAVVTLSSSNTGVATVPASVTVAAGATAATFAVATNAVITPTSVNITATCNGASRIVTLTVNAPAALAGLTLNPAAVTGGANSTATVTLGVAAPAGGAVVTLTSSNVNAATVPASVTLAAGATAANFTVTSKAVTAATAVTITATYNGAAKTATLTVNPPAAALAGLTLNPATVTGGANSTATVTLGVAAPAGGAVVTLTSSNVNAATVPASVTLAAGATAANFTVTSKAVTAATAVTITATYNGAAKTATLTVNAPAALAGLTLNPAAVTGGANSTATVTLGVAAPAGGAVVTLTSSNVNAATVPASVTLAAGATAANFTVTSKAVTAATAATITATYNGAAKTATLTVNPPAAALAGLTLNPAAVTGGANSTATVTLGVAAPAGGAVVTLTSSNVNAATVPASVTLAAGATAANFTVTSKAVTAATAVTITATYNGAAKTATLTVNPPAAALAGLTLNPATVTGGANSTATVTLGVAAPAGGAVVTLTSSNVNAATVPASVTLAAGATAANFTVTSKAVTAATAATITATYNGAAKTATLTVNPPAALAGLTIAPAVIVYGTTATATVTLTSAAPAGGAVITLAATNYLEFTMPASITVAAGATSAKFTIGTSLFSSATTVSATYNGVTKTANLTSVDPTVVALGCAPNPVIAGTTTICTVTMNGIMPAATTVWILSDQPFFAPASGTVTVPAGASTTQFSITTTLVPEPMLAHISASALATATVTTPLTINLTNRGKKWVLNNVVFKDGGTATGYFTYDAATGTFLDANIKTTPGGDPNNPLGKSPGNLYYYPWPNGFNPTILDNWSTPSLLSLQTPAGAYVDPMGNSTVIAWTVLQLNFAQALTNAGGTIALAINPNVAYSTYCVDNTPALCTPPPANISQEEFAMPPNPWTTSSGFYFRVVVSGTVVAQ